MEALLARRKRFEGPKPALEEYGGAAGLKKTIRSPRSNNTEALLARRE
jgi:hypothetical protein